MWDRLENIAKGITWGLIILTLIHMCTSCGTTSKYKDTVSLTDIEAVKINSSIDSTQYSLIYNAVKDAYTNIKTDIATEHIHYSIPNEQGKQYITSIERSQSAQTVISEQHANQSLVIGYKRVQRAIDSLKNKLHKIEQSKEETRKTSGGVFSWTGKETATILAIILLIIVAWIVLKIRGFV